MHVYSTFLVIFISWHFFYFNLMAKTYMQPMSTGWVFFSTGWLFFLVSRHYKVGEFWIYRPIGRPVYYQLNLTCQPVLTTFKMDYSYIISWLELCNRFIWKWYDPSSNYHSYNFKHVF